MKQVTDEQKLRGRNYSKAYYEKNKDSIQSRARAKFAAARLIDPHHNREMKRKIFIKSMYGITINDYNAMLIAQNYKCKICGKLHEESPAKNRLHIDHNHLTKKVRGLLCKRCNTGLGSFDDDVQRLLVSVKYLEENKG